MPNSDEWRGYDAYAELQRELDDHDDTYDPEYREETDYCIHGTYIGPSEFRRMISEFRRMIQAERLAKIRKNAENAQRVLDVLLRNPRIDTADAVDFAQQSSFVNNPRSRYGRH